MEPLNSKDRLWAIVKLSLLFLLTFIVFVIAIFFDYAGVPAKENQLLKEENIKLKEELEQQNKLFGQVDSIYINVSKLDNDPNGIIKSTIANQLVSISGYTKSESKLTGKFATNAYNAYSIILAEKQKVMEGAGLGKDLGKLEQEIRDQKDEIRDLKDELKECQRDLRDISRGN